MADIPIIFSAPMIRALLDGRKTMTRRMAHKPKKISSGLTTETILRPSRWQRMKPGDRLWVRENWYAAQGEDRVKPRDMTPDWKICPAVDWDYAKWGIKGKLRVAMHMPRWASRLTLIVTATKIERLQDISEADAQAEGIIEDDGSLPDIWFVPGTGGVLKMEPLTAHCPSKVFAGLWRALHGSDAWDANPEVVALTFTVHKQNIDSMPKHEPARMER